MFLWWDLFEVESLCGEYCGWWCKTRKEIDSLSHSYKVTHLTQPAVLLIWLTISKNSQLLCKRSNKNFHYFLSLVFTEDILGLPPVVFGARIFARQSLYSSVVLDNGGHSRKHHCWDSRCQVLLMITYACPMSSFRVVTGLHWINDRYLSIDWVM